MSGMINSQGLMPWPNNIESPPPYRETLHIPLIQSIPDPFTSIFTSVSFHNKNALRFTNFPELHFTGLRHALNTAWIRGVKRVKNRTESKEVLLNGSPWKPGCQIEAMASIKFVRNMMEKLWNMGWVLQAALDIGAKKCSKDTLFFRSQSPPPSPHEWLVITFGHANRLTVLSDKPVEFRGRLVSTFQRHLTSHMSLKGDSGFSIELRDMAWFMDSTHKVNSSGCILELLHILEIYGYTLYTNISHLVPSGNKCPDILVVHRKKGWVRGDPVWHR